MRKNKFIIETKTIYEKTGEHPRRVEGVAYHIERFDKCLVPSLLPEGTTSHEKPLSKNPGSALVKIEEKHSIKIWRRFLTSTQYFQIEVVGANSDRNCDSPHHRRIHQWPTHVACS